MSDMNFDFNSGVEEGVVLQGGGKVRNTKLPAAGEHMARIRSIIHLGRVESFYNGESKGVVPKCVVVFELKEDDDFETDGSTPLTITKDIDIKRGDKANISLLINAFKKEDGTAVTNFDEFIGSIGTVTISHSKCGKYANVVAFNKGGVSSLHPKMFALVGKCVGGVGNVKFSDMTEEALSELHSYNHIADMLCVGEDYEGSKAQQLIEDIRSREGRESYGIRTSKDKYETPAKNPNPIPEYNDDEEF